MDHGVDRGGDPDHTCLQLCRVHTTDVLSNQPADVRVGANHPVEEVDVMSQFFQLRRCHGTIKQAGKGEFAIHLFLFEKPPEVLSRCLALEQEPLARTSPKRLMNSSHRVGYCHSPLATRHSPLRHCGWMRPG